MFSWLHLFLFIVTTVSKELNTSQDRVYSLRCLLEEHFEPCQAVEDESFSRNISALSPQVIRDFYKFDEDVVQAISTHNFSGLTEKSFQSVPAGIILLLPICHLSSLKIKVMKCLLEQWGNNELVFKHLVKAILYSGQLNSLSEKDYCFSDDNLRWIAEVASFSDLPAAKKIIGKLPLLFYSPPEAVIILNNKYEKFYLLSVINKPANFKSSCSNKCLLRFWAYNMIKIRFPEPLEKWISLYTERWGYILTGATADEIKNLSENSFYDLFDLYSFNFSSVQVRTLYDKFYQIKALHRTNYSILPDAVMQLLPHQLITLPSKLNFEKLNFPSEQSRPSAYQLLEIMASGAQNQKYLSKFSYVLPLESFKKMSQELNMSSILHIESEQLSKIQLYYLANGGRIFNITSENIFEYSRLLKVMPSRDILFNKTASHVLLHILSNADSYNVPQVFALLNKLWSDIGPDSVINEIFRNDQSNIILEYLPIKYVLKSANSLIKLIHGDNLKKLPRVLIASLTKRFKDSESNFQFYNLKENSTFLYSSMSCDDISSLDPYYFTYTLSQYNNNRKLTGEKFPKKLQNCCINKLLELLRLKSLLVQKNLSESKLSLLNEAEINAIGGYIFSALPISAIKHTKNAKAIIKSIGILSIYELLSATSLTQLKKLSSSLAETLRPLEKISTSLFDLGNLTLFLEKQYIEKISEEYFKLILESDYIDHRLCSDQETRSVWYSLIRKTFDEPSKWSYQTLITLGDFLIVVPLSELNKISEEAWIYAADIISTKYYDTSEIDNGKQFYKVCLSHLVGGEKNLYISDLRKLITTLVQAAQLQINTVVSAETLYERKTNASTSKVYNFLDSDREIKLSLPSIKSIIDDYTESPTFVYSSSRENQYSQHTEQYVVNYYSTEPSHIISSTHHSDVPTIPLFTEIHHLYDSSNSSTSNFTDIGTNEQILIDSSTFYEMLPSTSMAITFNSSTMNYTGSFENNIEPFSENKIKTSEKNTPSSFNELTSKYNASASTSHSTPLNGTIVYLNNTSSLLDQLIAYTSKPYFTVPIQSTPLFRKRYSFNDVTNSLPGESHTPIKENEMVVKELESTNKRNLTQSTVVNTSNSTEAHIELQVSSSKLPFNTSSLIWAADVTNNNSQLEEKSTVLDNNFGNIYEDVKDDIYTSLHGIKKYSLPTNSPLNTESYTQSPPTIPSYTSTGSLYNENKQKDIKYSVNYEKLNTTLKTSHFFSNHSGVFFLNTTASLESDSFNNFSITNSPVDNSLSEVAYLKHALNKQQQYVTQNEMKLSSLETQEEYNSRLLLDVQQHENSVNSNIADFLSLNNTKYQTEYLGMYIQKPNLSDSLRSKTDKVDDLMNPSTMVYPLLSKEKPKKMVLAQTKLKVFSRRKIAEIPFDKHNKRSIESWSCDALKMVGKPTEIILNENVISNLDDKDLLNCIDLFSEMDLPKSVKRLIWMRIHLENIVFAGKLVAASNLSDIINLNFLINNPWSLETIYLLGKYNANHSVRQHIVKSVWKNTVKPFSVELVVSLGSLVCELPEISSAIITPNVLYKSSVVLGKALPCNFSCLSTLSHIATQRDAFNTPSKWSFGDVHNLGILVSGLNISEWKKLVLKNREALSGLTEAAFECLPYKYIKIIKEVDEDILPITITNRFEHDTRKRIMTFDFFDAPLSEVPSLALSSHSFSFYKHFIIFYLFITLMIKTLFLY